jgi:hypothetical protein
MDFSKGFTAVVYQFQAAASRPGDRPALEPAF